MANIAQMMRAFLFASATAVLLAPLRDAIDIKDLGEKRSLKGILFKRKPFLMQNLQDVLCFYLVYSSPNEALQFSNNQLITMNTDSKLIHWLSLNTKAVDLPLISLAEAYLPSGANGAKINVNGQWSCHHVGVLSKDQSKLFFKFLMEHQLFTANEAEFLGEFCYQKFNPKSLSLSMSNITVNASRANSYGTYMIGSGISFEGAIIRSGPSPHQSKGVFDFTFATGSAAIDFRDLLQLDDTRPENIQALHHLMDHGLFGDSIHSPLLEAAKTGKIHFLEVLIKDDRTDINETDVFGRSILLQTLEKRHLKAAFLLIANGAQLSCPEKVPPHREGTLCCLEDVQKLGHSCIKDLIKFLDERIKNQPPLEKKDLGDTKTTIERSHVFLDNNHEQVCADILERAKNGRRPMPFRDLEKVSEIAEILIDLHPDESDLEITNRMVNIVKQLYGKEAGIFLTYFLSLTPAYDDMRPPEERLQPMVSFLAKVYNKDESSVFTSKFFDINKEFGGKNTASTLKSL